MTLFNDEWVYKINFEPKEQGIFQGILYIAATNYAILQFDYEFATGKSTENINLLGIGHKVNYKKAQVIYENAQDGDVVMCMGAGSIGQVPLQVLAIAQQQLESAA